MQVQLEYAQRVVPVLRSTMFEPRGITVPVLPISSVPLDFEEYMNAMGVTRYRDKEPFEWYISPRIDNPLEVASTMAHEMVHAALPYRVAHGKEFARIIDDIGLLPPYTATSPGPSFVQWFEQYAPEP